MSAQASPIRKRLRAALLAAPLILAPAAAPADQSDRIVFSVSLNGLPAGELALNGKIEGSGYGVAGRMETTGLIGLLTHIRYDAKVNGRYAPDRFTPDRFDETARRGSSVSTHVIRYRAGTPVEVSQIPPRKPRDRDVDPADQGGTIDPLTALYAALRDVDRDEACKLSVFMFDGSKRSSVALGAPRSTGRGGVTCSGEYRRIGGFSEREMKEKSLFPFTLTYALTPDGKRLRVVSIDTDTILGKGRLTRQ